MSKREEVGNTLRQYMEDRSHINICAFPGNKDDIIIECDQDGTYASKYSNCNCHRRLIAIDKKTLKCPQCGQIICIKSQKQAEKELKSKHGKKKATQTFLISQKRTSEEDKYRTEDERIAGGQITYAQDVEWYSSICV